MNYYSMQLLSNYCSVFYIRAVLLHYCSYHATTVPFWKEVQYAPFIAGAKLEICPYRHDCRTRGSQQLRSAVCRTTPPPPPRHMPPDGA
ncbi:hypothetical protein BST61_g3875 [Cercospora zeina]